ncbi:MAG TPA: trypsin-like serine protease [Gaiellaceae bacterium]|jgi:V8-like Glu-specific endopeptidase
MRPLLRALLATTVIALASAAPAGAILDGTPDTDHPYVGILVTVVDGQRVPVCSGFLVSSTVFVTAAHCIKALGDDPASVSFDQTFTASSELRPGRAVPNPAFGLPEANTHDVALVVLDDDVTDRRFAELPSLGLLDSAAKKDALTIVGYGANGFLKHGVPDSSLVRSFGEAQISKLAKGGFNLRMSSGICFGDSGGPVLLGTSDVAVGINSYVNSSRCASNAFAFRLDTREAQDFLAPYL